MWSFRVVRGVGKGIVKRGVRDRWILGFGWELGL